MVDAAADRAAVRIFDLIDEGKLAPAETLLETALAKFPDNHGVLAAEALLLLKINQRDKAREKAEALSRQNVVDGKAINALVHVLQQCCSWEALAKTYERIKGIQDERNVMENLVHTYVSMGAYDMAQKTATQLYRKWGHCKYQVWVVQANLCQVSPESTDHLLLRLASKMIDTAILTEKGLITPSTSRMYVDVLHQQLFFDKAVDFLCSARGAAVGVPETRLELLATSLQRQGELEKANAVAKYLWTHQPDNWTFVDLYLNTLSEKKESTETTLELDGPNEEARVAIQLSDGDHTLEDALSLCRILQSKPSSTSSNGGGRPCRGPFMAELEILSRQGSRAALQEMTVAYAKRFYHIACCFLDISTYLDEASSATIYAWSREEKKPEEDVLRFHTRRIFGLRCYLALWGLTRERQPDHSVMDDIFKTCRNAYNELRPLSVDLAWSEEGLFDGYITIALNVVLHAYHATRDLEWVKEGLLLLDSVDRKQNNPTWLIYSVCFCRLMGLADVESVRQLAFKSLQHDTMSHVGYWPLLAGVALDEICRWNDLAWEHYRALKKDCGMLRARVFAFLSAPVMKDIQEFERRQMNSIARIISGVHRIVAALRGCQTQRNVFDLMRREETMMVEAFAALEPSREFELTDNTDWVVVRSLVLGNIHGAKVGELADTLVGMPSREERVKHTRELLGSLMLLHDVALLEEHRMKVENAPRPKKTKKSSNAAQAPVEALLPRLLCKEKDADLSSLPTLPIMSTIAPTLLEFIKTEGKGSALPHTDALQNFLQIHVKSKDAHTFLFPEALILTSILQVGAVSKLPILAWSNDLQKTLQQMHDEISHDHGSAIPLQGRLKELSANKTLRIKELSNTLLREVLAAGRRR